MGWEDSEVTAQISGEANVKQFQKIQRDFRSELNH
jgi:threonine aldolase